MNTKVWYLPYFEGVHHSRMIENILECEGTYGTYGSYYEFDINKTYT